MCTKSRRLDDFASSEEMKRNPSYYADYDIADTGHPGNPMYYGNN